MFKDLTDLQLNRNLCAGYELLLVCQGKQLVVDVHETTTHWIIEQFIVIHVR